MILASVASGSAADACVPPERPFLPQSSMHVRTYADLIRGDFEGYLAEAQLYLRCLDAKRTRAFIEAQQVSEEYAHFLGSVEG